MSNYMQPKIHVNFNVNGNYLWHDQYMESVPAEGEFILYAGTAYVVVEVWNIFDKHGPHVHGINVFLEEVDIMNTRLGSSDPKYYSGSNVSRT